MAENDNQLQQLQARWQADPSSRVFLQLAEEFRRRSRFAEAIEVLEKGLQHAPNHLSAQVALGRCHLESGDPESARTVLEQVIRKDATQLVANKLLVEACLQTGQITQAKERLEIYRLLNDRDPEIDSLRDRLKRADAEARGVSIPGQQPNESAPAAEPSKAERGWSETDSPFGDLLAPSPVQPLGKKEEAEDLFPQFSQPRTLDSADHLRSLGSEGLFSFAESKKTVAAAAPVSVNPVETSKEGPQDPDLIFQTLATPQPRPERASSVDEGVVFELPQPPRSTASPLLDVHRHPMTAELPLRPQAKESSVDRRSPLDEFEAEVETTADRDVAHEAEEVSEPELLVEAEVADELGSVDEREASSDAAVPEAEIASEPEPVPEPVPDDDVAPVDHEAIGLDDQPEPSLEAEILPADSWSEDHRDDEPPLIEVEAQPAGLETPSQDDFPRSQLSPPVEPKVAEERAATATLGQLYLQQGHQDEAERIFRKVLQGEPANPIAIAGLQVIAKARRSKRLTASDLLQEVTLPSNTGLTARKVVLLERYLRRLRRSA